MTAGAGANTCCGLLSLQTGVKLIAITSLLWSLTLIAFELLLLYSAGLDGVALLNPEFIPKRLPEPRSHSGETGQIIERWALPVCWMGSWVIDVTLSLVLYQGARAKHLLLCLIWFHIRCAALAVRLLFLVIYVLTGNSIVTKVPVVSRLIFALYAIWIVNRFISQLRTDEPRNNSSSSANSVNSAS